MFNEANSVEDYVRDLLCGKQDAAVREPLFKGASLPALAAGLGWHFIPADQLPRDFNDVLVEPHLREALIRLNPEIAEKPDRADEVFYKLRAILLSVQSDGLVRANEEFTAWLRGERSMPFGPNNEHTPVRLIDFETLGNNRFVCTQQFVYSAKKLRPDLVLFVNGIPVIVGETKTPVRPAISWVDAADDILNDYEVNIPALFVPNVFSFATEGKTYRFGSIRMPLDLWAPWRDSEQGEHGGLSEMRTAVESMLRPEVVLDILGSFTLFATDKKRRKIKIISRYQQYEAVNQIVERVLEGRVKKGLIWHFQGSGKSLLMVFAAQKLRLHPALQNPTVIIVVDRIDLDTQITATFSASDIPNVAPAVTRNDLRQLLAQDVRKIIITTIHKFGEAPGVLNDRKNIIVMVDEAHRTQEGDLGRKMREALPNAFLFGLTGTPINRADRNTFWAFGAAEDGNGYMSKYSFEESIRDKATLPLHFEARLVQLRIDKDAIDEAFKNITSDMSEEDAADLSKMAAKMGVLVKSPERIQTLVKDIVEHYETKVEPNGFKAQVVTFDRESCHLFKQEFDKILPPEASAVVMTVASGETEYKKLYERSKDDEERLLDNFRDPNHPLKFLIVTSKLLTGFDAPILQAMYLDKPMKDHTLLQAICRTNRPYTGKTHGLVVDYLGIFDDVGRALMFDEKSIRLVITNLEEVKAQLSVIWKKCVDYFPGVNRKVSGYEGLIAAQQCLPNNEKRDAFAADFSVFARVWEALSPDSCLKPYEDDYRWLGQVYESVKPPSGNGKLLWHTLGAKTVELIHQNVHVEAVQDNLETLVMDENLLKEIIESQDPTKIKLIEINIIARIRKHSKNPKFIALGQRLEELKERHEKGLLTSLAFLKLLLELAKDVVAAEKEVVPTQEQDRGKAALTELFKAAKNTKTPVMVERVVSDIDAIVRAVRFDGWQQTTGGEREIKRALRSTLLKYQLHREQELFDRAYEYIRQYY